MGSQFIRRRLSAWIACFAILFAALAPAAAHALASVKGQTIVEICSAEGMRSITLDADGKIIKDSGSKPGKHCPACQSPQDCVPPMALQGNILPGGHAAFPPLFYQSAKPQFNWSSAKPRGPPANS